MVLNAYAMSWFDFQNKCRQLGQQMPLATHHKKLYWTKYYKRQSDWIGKYGCYHRTDLTEAKTFNFHLPSAGICQEFCMEDNESNKLLFFGVQKEKCICLSEQPATPSLVLNQCNFDCLINNFPNNSLECGEGMVFSVFVSEKGMPDVICNDSNVNCYHKEEHVKLLTDETCNSVYEHYRDKCFIELTTQIYTSFDKGKKLSKNDQRNILFCEQCTEQGCLFANCKSQLNTKYCTKGDGTGIEHVFDKQKGCSTDMSKIPMIELRVEVQSLLQRVTDLEKSLTEKKNTIQSMAKNSAKSYASVLGSTACDTPTQNSSVFHDAAEKKSPNALSKNIGQNLKSIRKELDKSDTDLNTRYIKSPPCAPTDKTQGHQIKSQPKELCRSVKYKGDSCVITVDEKSSNQPEKDIFLGVSYRKTARYYLSGIDKLSTSLGIQNYIQSKGMKITHFVLFKPKHRSRLLSAKLNVPLRHAESIEHHDFWPNGVRCRKWLSERQWEEKCATPLAQESWEHDIKRKLIRLRAYKKQTMERMITLLTFLLLSTMVRILTWNVRGAMSSTLCLNSLLDNTHCDIAVISGHKLKNQHNGKMYLDSIHKDYLSIVKIDENDTYTTPNVYFIELDLKCTHHYLVRPNLQLPAWHKATSDNIVQYKEHLETPTIKLMEREIYTPADTEVFLSDLVNILLDSATVAIPHSGFNPYTRPGWTRDVKELHTKERQLCQIWISEGRPRGMIHESYRNYKRAKRHFRTVLDMEFENHMKGVYRDLDTAAECDIRLFWKLVKKQKKRTSRTYPEIHGDDGAIFKDPEGVAEAFAMYYEKIYTPSEDDTFDEHFRQFIESKYRHIEEECTKVSGNIPGGPITTDDLSPVVNNLKRRKSPGPDRITYEHIIFGGKKVPRCIVKLLNAIILHGKIPPIWKQGLIVPLYKGGDKQKTSTNSYRPVALLSCFLKIFENVLNSRISKYVLDSQCFPNKQQQGF
uniref:WSC domain-containing protein n=1 Tax=Magallana gigas TaxID=29159 RepID=A0A8W8LUB3_MAGGI